MIDLASELIAFAEKGKHTKFQLLRNYKEYQAARKVRYSLKLFTRSSQQSANKLFKNLKNISSFVCHPLYCRFFICINE